jgi:hypothetical protein
MPISGMPRIAIAATNFDALLSVCRDALQLPLVDISPTSVPDLGARVAMCVPSGGSCIELMGPAVKEAPLSMSLQKFLDKRGDGLFALMLEAPNPNEEAVVLAKRGLNVLPLMAGAGGRDVHPNATCGTLIRVYPDNSFKGERVPAQLTGIMKVIMAVWDVKAAAKIYGERFGLAIGPAVLDSVRGVESVIVRPGTGGVIELVSVRDATKPFAAAVALHLKSNPEGMYALVLQAKDPKALVDGFRKKGLDAKIASDDKAVVEIARESMFGALLRIEPMAEARL